MNERSQADMSTEPKTITLEVKKESANGDDRWWEIKVVAKGEKGAAPSPRMVVVYDKEWSRLASTDTKGEASFELHLVPQEPPETQVHPNLWMEVEPEGDIVTFRVRVCGHDEQPIPGVELTFSSALGTFEQQGLVITDEDGRASCSLVRGQQTQA
jgi:hypothetical protein